MTTGFPTEFPLGSVQTLIGFISGRGDKWSAIEAAYDLLGYAIHMIQAPLSTESKSRKAVAVALPTEKDAAYELDLLTQRAGDTQKGAGPIHLPDWFTAFVLEFLKKHLTT